MFGTDRVLAREIGDGLCDFRESKIGARRQTMSLDGMCEHGPGCIFEFEMLTDMFAREFGIGGAAGLCGACGLAIACRLDSSVNAQTRFAWGDIGELGGRDF